MRLLQNHPDTIPDKFITGFFNSEAQCCQDTGGKKGGKQRSYDACSCQRLNSRIKTGDVSVLKALGGQVWSMLSRVATSLTFASTAEFASPARCQHDVIPS
eukprot:3961752-Amphidinium_carterae.2